MAYEVPSATLSSAQSSVPMFSAQSWKPGVWAWENILCCVIKSPYLFLIVTRCLNPHISPVQSQSFHRPCHIPSYFLPTIIGNSSSSLPQLPGWVWWVCVGVNYEGPSYLEYRSSGLNLAGCADLATSPDTTFFSVYSRLPSALRVNMRCILDQYQRLPFPRELNFFFLSGIGESHLVVWR